jgi:hypothetical protein
MQSNPKPKERGQNPARTPGASPVADVSGVDAGASDMAHASPARALQNRLVRELNQPNQPWLWHTTGLVMTLILSLWAAGLMLNAGV